MKCRIKVKKNEKLCLWRNSLSCNKFGCFVQIKTFWLKILFCYWLVNVIIFNMIFIWNSPILRSDDKILAEENILHSYMEMQIEICFKTLELHRLKTCSMDFFLFGLVRHICLAFLIQAFFLFHQIRSLHTLFLTCTSCVPTDMHMWSCIEYVCVCVVLQFDSKMFCEFVFLSNFQ